MTSSIPSVDAAKARLLANIADLHDLIEKAFSATEREIYNQALAQAVVDLEDLNDRAQHDNGPKQQQHRRARDERREEEKEEETAAFYDHDDMILVSYNYQPPGEAPDGMPVINSSDDDDSSSSENDSHDLSSPSPLPPPASRDGALVGSEQAAL